jgi:hypothetical protein
MQGGNMKLETGLAAVFIVAAITGCHTIGPGSIQRDRIDYGGAIADSWKEQTLINIVKIRYFDTPTFLDVSSVISSYQMQGEVRFSREVFPSAPLDTNRTFGLTGIYTDRPTISYAPLSGEKFVNSLLRPIPPQAVFAMIAAGHQADYIFQSTVRAINDVYNHSTSPTRERREDAAFANVAAALRRIQQAGALGMRVERRGNSDESWIFFRDNAGEDVAKDVRFLREALGVEAGQELRLTFGALRRGNREVALLTRSIMEMLVELAAGVEVPEQHVVEGRVRSVNEPMTGGRREHALMRIHSGASQPQDAYVAVRYRNLWFWVDDRDLPSKRVFTFLRMFSSIAETGVTPQLPLLTIPAN